MRRVGSQKGWRQLIRINLSPKKIEKKRENVRIQIMSFVLVLTAVLAGCFLVYNQKASEVAAVRERVEQKKKYLQTFQQVENKLREMQNREKDLQDRLATVQKIIKRRDLSIMVLDEISKTILSDKMWLVNAKEDNLVVTIEGYAMDNQTIAFYMKQLEASPIFAAIELGQSKQESVADVKLQRFTITMRVKS